MNELIYAHGGISLWFDCCEWEFKMQLDGQKSHVISYRELIETIKQLPDLSEAAKRYAIIHFGKRAGIIKEAA